MIAEEDEEDEDAVEWLEYKLKTNRITVLEILTSEHEARRNDTGLYLTR